MSNLDAAILLLRTLRLHGLVHAVVCPGSRSAPLAMAAGLLERGGGLQLHTAIDERSAAFFALGIGRAEGCPAAVLTTSGTAVANLLPAAVEADHGTIPLLLLSADRPARLKGCGANQSVNQEAFLACSCRWLGQGDPAGLARMGAAELEQLAAEAMGRTLGDGAGAPPGPVHLNLAFDDPLHASGAELEAMARSLTEAHQPIPPAPIPLTSAPAPSSARSTGSRGTGMVRLDPDQPGLVVAGPWRGPAAAWAAHVEGLRRWQRRTGWPVLADGLSGLRGLPNLELVVGYDLLLEAAAPQLAAGQVLRLGPLPASRRLQQWLQELGGTQVLISEADDRCLDPLGVVRSQWSAGLPAWLAAQPDAARQGEAAAGSRRLAQAWQGAERKVQALLQRQLAPILEAPPNRATPLNEPWLARRLSQLLPTDLPLMLANSSPVRDWESFGDACGAARPVFAFRGASGIDGTLSIACGLAQALGRLVLLSGDLALLHDANGWLWRHQLQGQLTVVMIDNGGGGIFEQLPIRTEPEAAMDFERLFAMPQALDPIALAAVHGVPGRRVEQPEQLEAALGWALTERLALLVLRTDRRRDAVMRQRLRTMAAEELAAP